MDFWHFFLLITTILGVGTAIVLIFILRKMDAERMRMEDYLVEISQVMSDYYGKISAMFSQSIHYYDETIYHFVESTKEVKETIDSTLDEYEDLREYIVPVQTPEEINKDQQQKELLGVVRNYPIRKV